MIITMIITITTIMIITIIITTIIITTIERWTTSGALALREEKVRNLRLRGRSLARDTAALLPHRSPFEAAFESSSLQSRTWPD